MTIPIREVTTTTATNTNLFSNRRGVIQDEHAPAALAKNCGTEQARRPGPNDDGIPTHSVFANLRAPL